MPKKIMSLPGISRRLAAAHVIISVQRMRPILYLPSHSNAVSSLRIKFDLSISGFPKVLEPPRKGHGSLVRTLAERSYGFKLHESFYQYIPKALDQAYQSGARSGDRSLTPVPTYHNSRAANQPHSEIERSKITRHLSVSKVIFPSGKTPPQPCKVLHPAKVLPGYCHRGLQI